MSMNPITMKAAHCCVSPRHVGFGSGGPRKCGGGHARIRARQSKFVFLYRSVPLFSQALCVCVCGGGVFFLLSVFVLL